MSQFVGYFYYRLSGGIPAINDNQMYTLPGSFVLKLASDFPEVAIRDGLSQLVICEHARYMQVLNGYQGVVFAEIAGEFVRSILTDMATRACCFASVDRFSCGSFRPLRAWTSAALIV